MTAKQESSTVHRLSNEEKLPVTIDESSLKPAAESEKRPPISNYWRVLLSGTRQEHGLLLVGFCCAAGSGVALPLFNIVFSSLVGNFNSYFTPGTTTTKSEFLSSVRRNALFIIYLFIGKFALTYIGAFCFRCAGLRISANLRLKYLQSLFAQPIRKLDEISAGTVSNTITSNANNIQFSISEKLAQLFQSLALVISAYAIAFSYSWALTLVSSSALLFIIVLYSITTPIAIRFDQRVDKADKKHAAIAGEIFSSIRTVFSLGAEKPLSEKYYSWVDESRKRGLEFSPLIGMQMAPIFFSMYASFSLSFWFGLRLFGEGHINHINTVIVVIFSVLIVVGVLGGIVHPIMLITKAITASASFFEMIDAPRVSRKGQKEPDVTAKGDIEFCNVNFAYPTRSNVQVLKSFSAVFEQGMTTALVGPSGCGKSTIVALLERWYELLEERKDEDDAALEVDAEKMPRDGRDGDTIRVGGSDISTFDLKWWRTQIGLVSQEPFLFNDTILNNVAFGLLGTQWEHASDSEKLDMVKEACREAFADEFVGRLPKGYNTMVGESGIKLSGGQRQRLAIARSIIRQPAILVLDEATSSIDIRSEKIVQEALDRVSKSRTTIVIAHRLSSIKKADRIIVLREGAKAEEGTHEELMTLEDGLYSGLVHAQQLESQSGPAQDADEDLKPLLSRQATQTSLGLRADEEIKLQATWNNKGFFSSVGVFLNEQRKHLLLYVVTVSACMGAGTAFPLQAWFFSQLIQVFRFTGQALVNARNHWSLMFFALALGMAGCYFFVGFASTSISYHVACACRKDYYSSIIGRDIPFFDGESNASGSLMSRLETDPRLLWELLGMGGAFPLISCFSIIGCIIISFYFGWKLSLVALFAIMPVLLISSFVRLRHEHTFEEWNAKVFASSSQFATEAVGAFRTVSSLTMEDTIIAKYSALLADQIKLSTRKSSYAMLVYAFTESIELPAMALTFWYGGQLLGRREYNPLQFFVIYIAIIQGSQGAGQFFSFMPNIARATAAANRILSLRELFETSTSSQPLPSSTNNLGAAIKFSNVSYNYSSRTTPTFLNLSLVIPAGSYVAFVGASGVGKSTIISLLERFYTPFAGQITYDDTPISSIDVASYRSAISLVAQEPKLFEGTIKENLLLGVSGRDVSKEDMEHACRDAEIHDFISSLPEGYDTELGLNSSTALSGGQKQRLCLARALLRKPRLLLLDEATSSLDSQSEKLVQTAIERLAGERSMTVIAVAHRLATIQKADCIFVLGEGDDETGARLVESGSHRELLSRRGMYWEMCQSQALDR